MSRKPSRLLLAVGLAALAALGVTVPAGEAVAAPVPGLRPVRELVLRHRIVATITNVRDDIATIECQLVRVLEHEGRAELVAHRSVQVHGTSAICQFRGVVPGIYGLIIVQELDDPALPARKPIHLMVPFGGETLSLKIKLKHRSSAIR